MSKLRNYRLWFYWSDPSQDITVEYYGARKPTKLIKELEQRMGWVFVYYTLAKE